MRTLFKKNFVDMKSYSTSSSLLPSFPLLLLIASPISPSNSLLLSVPPLSFSFLPFPSLLVCIATSQIIRFSGNASVSGYEQALSSVFYMNAATAPSRTPLRRVTYEVTDGIFTSNTLTGLVNMTNRSPVVLLNATNQVSAFRFMSQTVVTSSCEKAQ